jgi:hypothetical protein
MKNAGFSRNLPGNRALLQTAPPDRLVRSLLRRCAADFSS